MEKHLWWSLFRLATLFKPLQHSCFPVNFAIFKNIYFVKHLQTAASERLWRSSKVLPYPCNIEIWKNPLKEHVWLKHILLLFWNVSFSLMITFCMEYCSEVFLSQNRSSRQRCSVRKGVLRNFAKFTGKYLCQSARDSFNKIAGWGLQLYWERDSGAGVFLLILRNF